MNESDRVSVRVALIMPLYNEVHNLPYVLESLDAQTFDHERMFFIAADGNSTDGTGPLVEDWLRATDIKGCLLSNPERRISAGLNKALKRAGRDDIIVRLDGHTVYAPAYVEDAVRGLAVAPADVACVGAAQVPDAGRSFGECVVAALYTNPMGLGGADFRVGASVREVHSVYLGAWRPGILQQCGGFNETLGANEDAEMAARLRQMGYRILRLPLECRFIINRGIVATIRQWNRYGYWRAKMLRRHPRFLRVRHVAVPAAAALALGLTLTSLRWLLLPLYALYAFAVFRGRAAGECLPVTTATLVFFPVLQFAFAAGMLAGVLSGKCDDWPAVTLRGTPAQMRS